jgi:hypothetical protein
MSCFEQQLSVDQELTEEDPGPPTQPEPVERRDPEPDGRPNGGDRRGVPERLAEFRRAEVRGCQRDDTDDVADGGPPKSRRGRFSSELSRS